VQDVDGGCIDEYYHRRILAHHLFFGTYHCFPSLNFFLSCFFPQGIYTFFSFKKGIATSQSVPFFFLKSTSQSVLLIYRCG